MNARNHAYRWIVAAVAAVFVGGGMIPRIAAGEDGAIGPAEPARAIRAPEPGASAAAQAGSWETIAATMQSAQTLLTAGDAGSATQRRQREALAHLDALIAAAAASAAAQASEPSDSGSGDPAASPGNATGTDGRAANPNAVESVERHGEVKVETPEAAAPRRTAAEEFWGRLPQHVRERVLQSAQTRGVPKYRAAIEEYFQRLLESEARRPE
ncbi:MAG: hypothetical protein DCC68_25220 [Planctomycetota bacterium]|nr:MAG: hypothetical protein DCC68_25220 [Planctomycetota bacterium]